MDKPKKKEYVGIDEPITVSERVLIDQYTNGWNEALEKMEAWYKQEMIKNLNSLAEPVGDFYSFELARTNHKISMLIKELENAI